MVDRSKSEDAKWHVKGDFEELTHTVMETKKFYNLLSACWRPRKSENLSSCCVNFSLRREDETAQLNTEAENRNKFIFPPHFVLLSSRSIK